jgi:hypothetical protein
MLALTEHIICNDAGSENVGSELSHIHLQEWQNTSEQTTQYASDAVPTLMASANEYG